MKKFLSIFVMILCILTATVCAAPQVNVTCAGQAIMWSGNALPYEKDGEIMLPLKAAVEAFGGTYQELESQGQKRAVSYIGSNALLVIVSSKEYATTEIVALENGKYTYLEPETHFLKDNVEEKNGQVYFPLSHFCAAFGCTAFAEGTNIDLVLADLGENAEILSNIATAYQDKDYSKCITLCNNALANDETHMEFYYYKAMSLFYSGDIQGAYDVLKKQLILNPNNELALYNAACAASLLGKEQESVDLLERLLLLDPTNKSMIQKDSDFDKVRNNKKYKDLMEVSVILGGEKLSFDVPPIIINGRTLLPMRAVFECFGAEVMFDEETQTAIATKGDMKIEIPIDSEYVKVNGKTEQLDVPAMIYNNRTLVPIRFVAETLHATVEWDGENEIVQILLPAPEGTADYDMIKKQLDELSAVSVVDGVWPEPYQLQGTEGISMIILKDKKGLELLAQLSAQECSKYIADTVYQNYALVVGCEPVYARVIYDGKMYYEGKFQYEQKDTIADLTYYANGKPVNVVKQYKSTFNYKDFYLLPAEEQVTSSIAD